MTYFCNMPILYTDDQVTAVCEEIASGLSLRKALKEVGIAGKTSFLTWLDNHPDHKEQYARARRDQAHNFADDIVEISDEETMTSEMAQRNRLRVDARKWVASKLLPKVYGDKQALEISGNLTLAQLVTDPAHKNV